MSISATDSHKKSPKQRMSGDTKTVLVYAGVTVFSLVLSCVYTYFGHGVTSVYMTWLSLVPLLSGFLPFLLIRLIPAFRMPCRLGFNLWNAGVGTATVGCGMKGAFTIGDNNMQAPLWLMCFGIALILLGVMLGYLTGRKRSSSHKE